MLIGTIVDKNIEYSIEEDIYNIKIENDNQTLEIEVDKETYDKYEVGDTFDKNDSNTYFTTKELKKYEAENEKFKENMDSIFMIVSFILSIPVFILLIMAIKEETKPE